MVPIVSTATGVSERTASWHMGQLDALRGIAVLGVILVHSWVWFDTWPIVQIRVQMLAMTGQRGVQLFFIVSAFTLFLSHDKRAQEPRATLNFFIRRFFRLAPMFYVAIALSQLFLRPWAGPARDALLSLFFLQGFSPRAINHGAVGGWSVADEALFYLTLPLLFRVIRNLRAALWALSIATPLLFLACWYIAKRHGEWTEFATFFGYPIEFPVFLMGIAGYFLWKEYLSALSGNKQLSLSLLIAVVLLYFGLMPFSYANLFGTAVVCLLLLLALSIYPWKLFVNPCTKFLGKISYSIYLLQFCVMRGVQLAIRSSAAHHPFLTNGNVQFAVCFLACTLITVPLAYVTWRWVEEPGIRMGRGLIARLNPAPEHVFSR